MKRRPARRRYASTATHSGESDGKPHARGHRWRISSPSSVDIAPAGGRTGARGYEDATGFVEEEGKRCRTFKQATGFAPCRRGNLSMIEWILAVALNGRQSIEPAEPRKIGKNARLSVSRLARGDGAHSSPEPPHATNAPDIMSVEDEGSTIFEAAADGEITESHWCVRANGRPAVETPAPDRRLPSRAGIPRAHERRGVTRRTRIPTPDAQGIPLSQNPQRRQGRRRVHQPRVRPRVQLHARVQERLPQSSGCGRRNRERRPRRRTPPGGWNVARRPDIFFESTSRFHRSRTRRAATPSVLTTLRGSYKNIRNIPSRASSRTPSDGVSPRPSPPFEYCGVLSTGSPPSCFFA